MTGPTCDHCQGPSVVLQRYSGAHLCGRHLQESVERRAQRSLSRQGLPYGSRLAVAYSAGKDSTVALHLVHDLCSTRPDLEVVAVTIDEGIRGYRPPALEMAERVCRALNLEQVVKRTKDFAGITIDQVHELDSDLGQCSFCGVFRRRLMNEAAKEVGATHLVTGHNLDDLAQSILMNLASANLNLLAKMGPHDEVKEGLIPRLFPLQLVPETEVYLYAMLRGLVWHDEECPYSVGALRGVYRDALYQLEAARPGTRHALLRTYETLKPLLGRLGEERPFGECPQCGEPTSGRLCRSCELRERLLRAAPAP